VLLAGRPPISYDGLSVDVGIAPAWAAVPGAAENVTPVKPISTCVPLGFASFRTLSNPVKR
jgi:selenide, water dikinase